MKRGTKSTKQKDLKKKNSLEKFPMYHPEKKNTPGIPFVCACNEMGGPRWAGPPSGKGYRSGFEMSTMGG